MSGYRSALKDCEERAPSDSVLKLDLTNAEKQYQDGRMYLGRSVLSTSSLCHDQILDKNDRESQADPDSVNISIYIEAEHYGSCTFALSEPSDGNLSYLLK